MKFYQNILFLMACLVLISLTGCSPDESDLTPPNAAFDGGVVKTPTALTTTFVSGTMDAGSTVSVYVTTGATVTGLTQVSGTWSFTVNNMVEGANIVQVSVADAFGNIRTIQLSIVVDLTGPVTTIKQYPLTAQAGTFTFAGTVSEAASSVFVEVYDSSVSPNLVASGDASVDADIWDVTLDLSLQPDDTYSVVATGTDRLLNESLTPAEQTITIDSALPSFTIDPLITVPVVLDTDVDLKDLTGMTSGSLLTVTPYATVTQPVGGDWSATLSGLPGGKTIVTFEAEDGIFITDQKVLVVRDQTAPMIVEWSTPAPNQIEILFNETIESTTVDVTNLLVVDSTGASVTVNSKSVVNKTVTFTTEFDLTDGETYTAALQTADPFLVEDGRGNSIAASYVWTFKKY